MLYIIRGVPSWNKSVRFQVQTFFCSSKLISTEKIKKDMYSQLWKKPLKITAYQLYFQSAEVLNAARTVRWDI